MNEGKRTLGTIVFHHIPKTAGTTMGPILRRQYLRRRTLVIGAGGSKQQSLVNFARLPQADKDSYQLLLGHQAIKLVDQLTSPTVITFLREPVSRVVSLYYFARDVYEQHPWHQATREYSLEELYRRNIHEQWRELADGQYHSLLGWQEFSGLQEREGIRAAIRGLLLGSTTRLHIGITERFDESLLFLKHVLRWGSDPYYARKNTNKSRVTVSPETREAILHYNQYDTELYSTAKECFEVRWEQMGAKQLEEEIQGFRRRNLVFGSVLDIRSRIEDAVSRGFRVARRSRTRSRGAV